MRNLKVIISYDGTAYHGYQSQDNAITVQDVIEATIFKVTGIPSKIYGCSRTDTGVHAKVFVFHFHTTSPIPCSGFIKAMNNLLPRDIAVLSCEEVDESFHSRFDAIGKEYQYFFNTSPIRNVFTRHHALHYPYPINLPLLEKACEKFIGTHDFAAFCTAEAKAQLHTTVRTITHASILKQDDNLIFIVRGTGFLHNMVRILAGTLVYINENKLSLDDIDMAYTTLDRKYAGKTLPPHGLYLTKVFYPTGEHHG